MNKSILRLLALSLILALTLPAVVGCDLMNNILGNSQDTDTSGTSDTSAPETSSATETSPEPETPAAYDPERVTEYELNAESPVLVTGRTISLDAGLALDLSASAMRFRTTGGGDVSLKGNVGGENEIYFTVYIDGERQPTRLMFPEGESTQVLAKDLANERHLIEIVRQTEGQFGTFTAEKITMKGSLFGNKPAEKKIYIEFIGDSITCGNGSLCKYLAADDFLNYLPSQSSSCIRSGKYKDAQWVEEDASNSYAYLTARHLNADCSLVSYSAMGLTKSWGGLNDYNMQEHFMKGAFLREGGETFDFSTARKPDFVVVNLGTNDVGQSGITETKYKAAVKSFINQIREAYGDPDLKIVWAVGLMGNGNYTWAKAAIDSMNDENLYTYQFSPAQLGHGSHPTIEQHANAAKGFRNYLKNNGFVPQ